MRIGDVIASIRRRKRIDQKELAEQLGIGVTYLSEIENSRKRPSIKLLRSIADKLEVPIDAILFMVLEEKYFDSEKGKEFFNVAKPVIEDVVNLLIDLSQDISKNKTVATKRRPIAKSYKKIKADK